MARQINSGSLPFALTVDSYSTISPSLGENSLSAMVLAGVIAFALIVVLMTALYRLPGFLACIALAGQVAATLAFVSGYFPVFESFTLTLPGIAGIILAIGMSSLPSASRKSCAAARASTALSRAASPAA